MNNYSLCIKYSLFHQPQSAQLCIFSLVLLLVKVFGHNCHNSSPHMALSQGRKLVLIGGFLCDAGHTHALTHFLLWTFQHMCSLQTLGHLMKRVGTLSPGLPFSDSFLTLSETYCFSPVGL